MACAAVATATLIGCRHRANRIDHHDAATRDAAARRRSIAELIAALRQDDVRVRLAAWNELDARRDTLTVDDRVALVDACAMPFPRADGRELDELDPDGVQWPFDRGRVMRMSVATRLLGLATLPGSDPVASAVERVAPRFEPFERLNALTALIRIDTPAAMDGFVRVATHDAQEQALNALDEHVVIGASNAPRLVPGLLEMPVGSPGEKFAWRVAAGLCLSGRLHGELAVARTRLFERLAHPGDDDLRYQLVGALGCVPGPDTIAHVPIVSFDTDPDLAVRAAIARTMLGRPSSSTLARIASDPTYRLQLFESLHTLGRSDAIPSRFRSNQAFAETYGRERLGLGRRVVLQSPSEVVRADGHYFTWRAMLPDDVTGLPTPHLVVVGPYGNDIDSGVPSHSEVVSLGAGDIASAVDRALAGARHATPTNAR